jgi:hypothetical protein
MCFLVGVIQRSVSLPYALCNGRASLGPFQLGIARRRPSRRINETEFLQQRNQLAVVCALQPKTLVQVFDCKAVGDFGFCDSLEAEARSSRMQGCTSGRESFVHYSPDGVSLEIKGNSPILSRTEVDGNAVYCPSASFR